MGGFTIPYASEERYDRRPALTIADLILQRGDIAARGAEQSGALWGQTLSNLGQIGAQGYMAYQEGKAQEQAAEAMAQRGAFLSRVIQESGGVPPPDAVFQAFSGLPDGDQRALAVIAGLGGYQEALSKVQEGRHKQAAEMLPVIATGYEAAPPNVQQELYPVLAQLGTAMGMPAEFFGEQYDPERAATLVDMAKKLSPDALEQVTTRNSDGSETIQWVQPQEGMALQSAAEPKERRTQAVGRYIMDMDTGEIIAAAPREPAAPKAPSFSPKTVTVDGQEVLANYDSTTGRYFDPETGEPLAGLAPPADGDAEGDEAIASMAEDLRGLSEKLITSGPLQQRAAGRFRQMASVFVDDPEFRTYQDTRASLAGALAKKNDPRPSDFDIRTLWLPIIPDVMKDSPKIRDAKWKFIYGMAGIPIPEDLAARTSDKVAEAESLIQAAKGR